MKIHHKITLISSFLFGLIFLVTSVIIYLSFYQSSKNIFFQELSRTAMISAMFYLERDELSQKGFAPVQEAFYNLSSDQEVSIFDEKGFTAFNTKKLEEDWSESLEEIKKHKQLNFRDGDMYYHGLYYPDNQGDFVVLVQAENPLIQSQKNKLIGILSTTFCGALIVLVILTSSLSRLAYRPVRNIINQVNALNLSKYPLQLTYDNTGDELEELFNSFNNLLEEIETAYQQQKNFVHFSSHELKTPLANIINQLEVSLHRERTLGEHKETSKKVLEDALQLKSILENLLRLSNLNKNTVVKEEIRVDEIIWEVVEQLALQQDPERFRVQLNISTENFRLLQVFGNKTLLYMALFNIIENAAKFSTKEVNIIIFEEQEKLFLSVRDKGIGIPDEDIKNINQPFFRSNNTSGFKGNGLGMSIALKILDLHDINHLISSKAGEFTEVRLCFPFNKD